MNKLKVTIVFFCSLILLSCNSQPAGNKQAADGLITCGAARLDVLIPLLQNKKVGLLVNQTSVVGATHLVDTLLASKITIKKIFAPEHGFRGGADAGEHVRDSLDTKTKIKII